MLEETLSVSEFISLVNQTLEFAYPRVVIEGEVSGFSERQDKWVFFDLKDEAAALNCFMVRFRLKTALEDGMRVKVTAIPKLTKWGRFSLTVEDVMPVGEGALRRAFELLKTQLTEEGLFAAERKRVLPEFPRTIGVVASVDSAAYRDFLKILNARWSGLMVKVIDVQVQGEPAPGQIVAAIETFNQLAEPVDVLVLTRGGGSLEDLQAFNTEPVVRAVATSRAPIIVGVGHEVDTTLADLAADLRASTPTDAARLVVPDKQEFVARLSRYQAGLENNVRQLTRGEAQHVEHMMRRLEQFLQLPLRTLEMREQRLTHYFDQLCQRLDVAGVNLLEVERRLIQSQLRLLDGSSQHLTGLVRTLHGMDPRLVLKRGYAVARAHGKIVRSAGDVARGDQLMVQLAEDELETEVKNVRSRS